MQNNRLPKIQIRLSFALALLIIIISLNSIIHILDVRNMHVVTQDIINHPYTVSNSVRDIEININAINRSMKDVALAKNNIQLNQAIEDVNDYEKIIYEKFDVVEERFLGDLNTVYKTKQTFRDWKPIRDEVIELVKSKRIDEATEITKGKGAIHVELLFTETHDMIEFANNKAKEFNENSIEIMNNARIKSLLMLMLTLVAGVIIFLWLFNSISKPIKKLINRVLIANKNQQNHKIPLHSNNHLLILDYAISELENRDKVLEEEIDTRTKELEEARNLIENAIEYASIGMTRLNFDGSLIEVNQAFCKFTGYSKEELVNMKFNDFTHEEDKQRSLEYINRIINKGVTNEVLEKKYIHKSGKIIRGSVTTTLVKDNHNKPIYLFAQIKDITEQKKYELELIEHKNELENRIQSRTNELENKTNELENKTNKLIKSQKALTYLLEDVNESQRKMKTLNRQIEETNKELEAFSYSVSHDLKAPLRAVTGFSQILSEEYSDELQPEAKRFLGLIIENAKNMGELINDLLRFSRLGRQSLQISEVNMNEIITRVINELKPDIEGRKLAFEIREMPLLMADDSLIYNVMMNLISNAVKFTSKVENARLEIGCENKDNKIVYYIKDNGIGFDMKYADKIFDVFQRLHSSSEFPGTGIGLSIVQRIIYKHKGKIWVQSELNKGTTFFFSI